MQIADVLPVRESCGHIVADRARISRIQDRIDRAADAYYAEHPDRSLPGEAVVQAIRDEGISCLVCTNAILFTPCHEDMLGIQAPATSPSKFARSGAHIEVLNGRDPAKPLCVYAR